MKRIDGGVMGGSTTLIEHEKRVSDRLRKQRQRLLKLRAHLSREIQQLKTEACEEIPIYSMHMADAATDSFDRDLVLGLASFEQEGLYEIDAALKRLEDGTYGVCEMTGKLIPWDRLEAIPWTRFSLEAEKQLEEYAVPQIGRLGTVRRATERLFNDLLSGFGNEDPDLMTDLDLLASPQRILKTRAQIDDQLFEE